MDRYLLAVLASLVLFISIINVAPVFSQTLQFPSSLSDTGVIAYDRYNFQIRGANVELDTFYPSSPNYLPDAWQLLKNLGVNTISVGGGGEGDLAHFNMVNYPNEWAQNLNNFLATASQNGIKVYFKQLGNKWGTLFNIVCPGGSDPYTPLTTAKMMIGELAGNNSLGHDFITDPRVLGWVTANEPDIANYTTLNWNLQLCDYIRSLGGKAWIAQPYHNGVADWSIMKPLLEGHVDYLEVHQYMESTFYSNMNCTAFYNSYVSALKWGIMSSLGSFSSSQIILGEFGIWIGEGTDAITANFTEAQRQIYYQAVFEAAKAEGIQNVAFTNFNNELDSPASFGVINMSGNPYPVYTTIQNIYV